MEDGAVDFFLILEGAADVRSDSINNLQSEL
jgi:hypothetical protein